MTQVDVGRPAPQAVRLHPDVADGAAMVRVPCAHYAGLSTEESRQLDQLLVEIVRATGDVPRPDASLYPADPDGF